MAKKEPSDKSVTIEDVQSKKAELAMLKMNIFAGKESNTATIKELKKEIARMLTKINGQETK